MASGPRTAGGSHASGAAEADDHLVAVDDDRDGATALAVAEHPLQIRGVLLDVDVGEGLMPPFIILTGGDGVRSSVFAEDVDHDAIVSHRHVTTITAKSAVDAKEHRSGLSDRDHERATARVAGHETTRGRRSRPLSHASTSAVFAVIVVISYAVPMSSARVTSVSGTGFAVA